MTRRHGDVPPIIRESGDPEPRTVDDVAAAHLQRMAYDDEIRELDRLLRAGLGQVAPWKRQSWMAEEDSGVLELAKVLHAWGVRVQR